MGPPCADVICVPYLGEPLSDVVSVLVVLLLEGHGAVAPEVLVEEARAAQPQPVEVVERVVRVEKLQGRDSIENFGLKL